MNNNDTARDVAIKTVEENSNEQWWSSAYVAGVRLSRVKETFISEDIFDVMNHDVTTHEPRAMGSVIKALQRDGYITPTDTFIKSPSPVGHSRPSRVWKSTTR